MTTTFTLEIDGRRYTGDLYQQRREAPSAPRLLVVAYQPNKLAQEVLRVCIETIERYTPEAHELWVIDNNSPKENSQWLLQYPMINVVLNHIEPIPPEQRNWRAQVIGRLRNRYNQRTWGSYANALGLEIGVRLIDPNTASLMTLHMDTMACHPHWLAFLQSKLSDEVAAAGVRLDCARTPAGVLHVLGYLVDFQRFRQLQLDFLPDLPQYDVGDRVTVRLREAGYQVFACRNTLRDPALLAQLPPASPFAQLHVDRAVDDAGQVIFLHLGRGLRKSADTASQGTTVEEWLRFGNSYLLQDQTSRAGQPERGS